jgi:ribosomal protein S18 acetylase RimI-like enzyme
MWGVNRPLGTGRARLRHDARLERDDPTLRAAEARDIGAVIELWALARSAHASTLDREADLRRLIETMPGALLVAEVQGDVVGALIAAWDGWRGNMYRLAVRSECRRGGIATKLVRAGEQRLHRLGARRVTALVAYDDPSAAAFWDAAGYPLDQAIGRRVRNL